LCVAAVWRFVDRRVPVRARLDERDMSLAHRFPRTILTVPQRLIFDGRSLDKHGACPHMLGLLWVVLPADRGQSSKGQGQSSEMLVAVRLPRRAPGRHPCELAGHGERRLRPDTGVLSEGS